MISETIEELYGQQGNRNNHILTGYVTKHNRTDILAPRRKTGSLFQGRVYVGCIMPQKSLIG